MPMDVRVYTHVGLHQLSLTDCHCIEQSIEWHQPPQTSSGLLSASAAEASIMAGYGNHSILDRLPFERGWPTLRVLIRRAAERSIFGRAGFPHQSAEPQLLDSSRCRPWPDPCRVLGAPPHLLGAVRGRSAVERVLNVSDCCFSARRQQPAASVNVYTQQPCTKDEPIQNGYVSMCQ
jgi:hypothetical protein